MAGTTTDHFMPSRKRWSPIAASQRACALLACICRGECDRSYAIDGAVAAPGRSCRCWASTSSKRWAGSQA